MSKGLVIKNGVGRVPKEEYCCPTCKGTDIDGGFGLAGGGYGTYSYCNRCKKVFDKVLCDD